MTDVETLGKQMVNVCKMSVCLFSFHIAT